MAAQSATASNPSIIPQGQSQTFIYVGNMIPNQVLIHNLSTEASASYILESGTESWRFFGTVPPGLTVSIMVEWPTGKAAFTNNSVANASIYVFGNGIFPEQSGDPV